MIDKEILLTNIIYKQIIHNLSSFFTHTNISHDPNAIYVFTKYMINNYYLTNGKIYNQNTLPNELINIENHFFGLDTTGIITSNRLCSLPSSC